MRPDEKTQLGSSYSAYKVTISEALYEEDHYCRDRESGFRLIIRRTGKLEKRCSRCKDQMGVGFNYAFSDAFTPYGVEEELRVDPDVECGFRLINRRTSNVHRTKHKTRRSKG